MMSSHAEDESSDQKVTLAFDTTDDYSRFDPDTQNATFCTERTKMLALFLMIVVTVACVLTVVMVTLHSNHHDDSSDTYTIQIIQLNDVYEPRPSQNNVGGLARVATLKKQLLAKSPYTYMMLAGDFVSPSPLGSAVVNGSALNGRQMVSIFNAMGMDYVTFGNHEFDIDQASLLARMNESQFQWIVSNARYYNGWPKLQHRLVLPTGPDQAFKLGIFGLCLDSNNPSKGWQVMENQTYSLKLAQQEVKNLQTAGSNFVIGLTHYPFTEDQDLVERVKGIHLIVGGHEHQNFAMKRGNPSVPIYKADKSAESAWVHTITVTKSSNTLSSLDSQLVRIDSTLPDDPQVKSLIDYWFSQGTAYYKTQGFDIDQVIGTLTEDLDGEEISIRFGPTALTDQICLSLLNSVLSYTSGTIVPDLVLANAGSSRVDDVIPTGTQLTQYDVLKITPYKNQVTVITMNGDDLDRTLHAGLQAINTGQFLFWYPNVTIDNSGSDFWIINGAPLNTSHSYTIATTDFLASSKETNPKLYIANHFSIRLNTTVDTRKALIDQLHSTYGT